MQIVITLNCLQIMTSKRSLCLFSTDTAFVGLTTEHRSAVTGMILGLAGRRGPGRARPVLGRWVGRESADLALCGAAGAVSADGVLGRVPQSLVDDEDCSLRSALEASLELRGLCRVADNALQQYVRSRPAPSPESIKRTKELDLSGLGLHPLFSESPRREGAVGVPAEPSPGLTCPLPPPGSNFEEKELQRLRLVDGLRKYRSRAVSEGGRGRNTEATRCRDSDSAPEPQRDPSRHFHLSLQHLNLHLRLCQHL